MTYSLNDIVNYEIEVTDGLTLFEEKIYPLMNITLNGSATCTWLVFPNDAPFKATIVNKTSNTIYPILASAFGSSGSLIEPSATIIEPGSNGQVLGGYTIYASGVSTFSPSGGGVLIGTDYVSYGGTGVNSLTLCTGGSGILSTSETIIDIPITAVAPGSNATDLLYATVLYVYDTTGFPTSGSISIDIGGVYQVVTYTGTTPTSFTGISNPSVVVYTGNVVTRPKAQLLFETDLPQSDIYVYSAGGFPSSFQFFAVNNLNQAEIVTYTGITALNTTVASLSNSTPLPASVIHVANATSFPGSGFIVIETTTGLNIVYYTGTSGTSFTGCTGGTGYIFTGYDITSTSFTGCTGGTGFINTAAYFDSTNTTSVASGSNGQVLGGYTIDVNSTTGFAPSGDIVVESTAGSEIVAYTGLTGTSFTGVTGGTGIIYAGSNGAVLPQAIIYVDSTANFLSSGTLLITDSNGVESITYTGTTANSFTGCSGGTGTLTTGDQVTITGTTVTAASDGYVLGTGYNIINVVSTADFGTGGGSLYFGISGDHANYAGTTPTEFTSVNGSDGQTLFTGEVVYNPFPSTTLSGPITVVAIASDGQTLPLSSATIHVSSTAEFASSGTILVQYDIYGDLTSVTYTSVTGGGSPSFNGCSGGTAGTMHTGYAIYQNVSISGSIGTIYVASTAGFPETGVLNANGIYNDSIYYTGKTSTTFTGCYGSGGSAISYGSYLTAWYGGGFDYIYPFIIGTTSYGVTLPQSTIYINSAGFPSSGLPPSGYFLIKSSNGWQYITYTGITTSGVGAPYFTGCSGGTGTLASEAPLAFRAATTITLDSNGVILGGDNFTVVSTAGFPSAGTIIVTDSHGNETLTYLGTTATSFNGCTGGTGTLSTGDPVNLEPTEIASAYTVATQYSAVLSNIDNVTDQEYVLIGNTSNNDANAVIDSFISSSSIGFNGSGTIPDPNDGYIIWALPDNISTEYKAIINPSGDEDNRVQLFISDGNVICITQNTQTYWENSEYSTVNGFSSFNSGQLFGNLISITFVAGATTAFDIGVLGAVPFSTVIENDSGHTLTFGYTLNGSSFSTNSIVIASGTASFIFGDGTNVFTTPDTAQGIATVLVNSSGVDYNIIDEPSGTTFLITLGYSIYISLTNYVPDGTQYTFKDQNNTFNANSYITFNTNGYGYIIDGGVTISQLAYNTPNLSVTLQYFATDQKWRVINKTDNELNPAWAFSDLGESDLRQQDYYLDTSPSGANGPISFYTYDNSHQPVDGQVFTLKDATQDSIGGYWATNPVTIYTNNINLEYPAGTINAPGTPVILSVNGLYLKFRYDPISTTWMLI